MKQALAVGTPDDLAGLAGAARELGGQPEMAPRAIPGLDLGEGRIATRAQQRLVLEPSSRRQLRERSEALLGEPGPFRVTGLRQLELAEPGIEEAQVEKDG